MVNLICRFYEPTKGLINVDGTITSNKSLWLAPKQHRLCPANPFVFSSSYKDNIRYGKLNATDEEIIAAAKLVGIHDFIMASPKATTPSSKMAAARSRQGQKQLVSFARAIIRNPSILILDEATSLHRHRDRSGRPKGDSASS
jgi:ABC-type multidrug transport system fused ATPase/permease subunit